MTETLNKTIFHDLHIQNGAKMGAFAGYDMPLYYGAGVKAEHEWTRTHAGIFDVSHMGQVMMRGANVAEFLEQITPSAFQKKKLGRAQYTVLTNEEGGMVDDLIVTRLADDIFFLVVNGACKEKDIAWIKQHLPTDIELEVIEQNALIALQGASAEAVLKEVFGYDAKDMDYMTAAQATAPCGADIIISRLGYTGEDGFEISLPNSVAPAYWQKLLDHEEVLPIGLAARDSLRLEMGYPLYGHDIDATTSPIEAGISWIIGKGREDFIGAQRVLQEKAEGTARQRVGIQLIDKGVAREGAEIRTIDDEVIGALTSGGFSPILEKSIAMGYVPTQYAQVGTEIFVNVRGRNIKAEIVKLPFLAPKTKNKK